jgi:TIR domain
MTDQFGADGVWIFVSHSNLDRPLLKRATVFFSHSRADEPIARQIYDALVEQDYRAFLDTASLTAGSDWQKTIQAALEDALEHGFVLLLLSPEYLTSAWCQEEREWALNALGSRPVSNIVPVIVRDPVSVYRQLPADLRKLQCIDTTKGSIVQNISMLLRDLKSRAMS